MTPVVNQWKNSNTWELPLQIKILFRKKLTLNVPNYVCMYVCMYVCKMRIICEPKKVELLNKRHFEKKRTENVQHFQTIKWEYFSTKYIKYNVCRLAVRYVLYIYDISILRVNYIKHCTDRNYVHKHAYLGSDWRLRTHLGSLFSTHMRIHVLALTGIRVVTQDFGRMPKLKFWSLFKLVVCQADRNSRVHGTWWGVMSDGHYTDT
jgi:hypothetical protein